MILYIFSTGTFCISNGLLAILKRVGVILFTLSSVHCALNKTAISNSNTLLLLSGTGVSG